MTVPLRPEWHSCTDGRFNQSRPWLWLSLSLFTLLVAGCATVPPPAKVAVQVDPRITMERFNRDQQGRRERLRHWQVAGVLEVSGDKGSRRYRTEIKGEMAQQAQVTLFGLMQQIVAVLFAGPEEIRLVDAEQRHITEVPASAAGLYHLIGIGLQPEVLFESMIAVADALTEPDAALPNGWWTRQGEQLLLNPETGLIEERSGETESGGSYRVIYQWPDSPDDPLLPMPTQVRVQLLPGETRIHYKARQWHTVEQPFAADWFSPLQLYPDFTIERPFRDRPAQP
ncbi:MAG: hypothetical protein HQL80_01740 [Magnetococcales bacterium]|nr:hypothetical protein [Magnetococcales bacterium]